MVAKTRFLSGIISICVFLFAIICIMPDNITIAKETGNTYYVSPTGSNKNIGSIDKPLKTMVFACRMLKPGDTLILREGTYKQDPITSYGGTGTAEKNISIKAYPNEKPVIDGGKYGLILNLTDKDYYNIEGIAFINGGAGIAGCSHINIRNCIFRKAGINIINSQKADSSYVTFENNYLTDVGDNRTDGEGDGIHMKKTSHCIIQNNYFANCGHYVINDYGTLDIIRNNIMEQRWGGGIAVGERILVEGNKIYYVNDHVDYPKGDMMCNGDNNIIRNNILANGSDGPYPGGGMSIGGFANDMHAIGNRIYNNILYKTGSAAIDFNMKFNTVVTDNRLFNNVVYYDSTYTNSAVGQSPTGSSVFFSAYFSSKETFWGKDFPNKNYMFNNILLRSGDNGDHPGYKGYFEYITSDQYNNKDKSGKTISYSFNKSVKDIQTAYPKYFYKNLEAAPLFVSPDTGDIFKDDFTVRKGSPAIDAGAHMAKATSDGNMTKTVRADDANCFFDGFGVTEGDAIKIGSSPVVRIVKIDYTAKIITVSSPVSYKKGDFIDIPYSGSAPDIGVYEFNPPALPSTSKSVAAAPMRIPEEIKKAYQIDLDDWNDIGREVNRIDYYGRWSAYIPGQGQYSKVDQDEAFVQTLHKSASNYGYYQVKFFGTGVKLYAPTGMAFGIAEVTVDNDKATEVDFYSEERKNQVAVFEKSGLEADKMHILKVYVTGRKNAASVDYVIPCDRVSIIDSTESK